MDKPRITTDSKEAYAYLIDPLTAPDPSDETGPNSHFRSTFAPASPLPSPPKPASPKVETNPFRRASATSPHKNSPARSPELPHNRIYPTPPPSASPKRDGFATDYRTEAFGRHTSESKPRRFSDHFDREPAVGSALPARGSSLRERFPGDRTHKPLSMLTKESQAANRSHHLRKKHLPGADRIDQLDASIGGGAYHHEGPYDAALPARNLDWNTSPVAAVAESNMEALKATPRENIKDALERHVPLTGTAIVAPGQADRFGRTYDYEEGDNMMLVDGGNYKRWPGVDYAPDDVKGKGEPSYSIEKAVKKHDSADDDRHVTIQDEAGDYEVQRSGSLRRHESIGKRAAEGIKRRFGSLRKKDN